MIERETLLKEMNEHKRTIKIATWKTFKRNKISFLSSLVILGVGALSVLGIFYTPYDPYKPSFSEALMPPSLMHPLGTDWLGRDILSRIIAGGKYTLGLAFVAIVIGATIGTFLGLASGYYLGLIGATIQRITEVFLILPTLIMATLFAAILGTGLLSTLLAVAIPIIPVYAKLVHSATLRVRNEDYIEAAKLLKKSGPYIMFNHILPNILHIIIVQTTYYMGTGILTVSALGFLGLGVPSPTPEWGTIVGDAKGYIFSYPYVVFIPGILIAIVVVAFNILGDGLREALDPKLRRLL
jgi:ABC-type dipeptide/oligopeptide/nickel transport system permease subunit